MMGEAGTPADKVKYGFMIGEVQWDDRDSGTDGK